MFLNFERSRRKKDVILHNRVQRCGLQVSNLKLFFLCIKSSLAIDNTGSLQVSIFIKPVTWYVIFYKLYCDSSDPYPCSKNCLILRAWDKKGSKWDIFQIRFKCQWAIELQTPLSLKLAWRSILGEYKLVKNRTSQNQFPLSNFKCHKNLWIRFLII